MDLAGQMLLMHLKQCHSQTITATSVCAPFHRRFTRLGTSESLVTADRFINRWRDYPRFVSALNGSFDLYHVVDHSYSHLVHHVPGRPTVVTCHDLDAFRCLVEPDHEPRSRLFKKVSQYVLSGLQQATRIACVSRATCDALLAHEIVAPERITVVPNGVDPVCSPESRPDADRAAEALIGPPATSQVEILHVGSTIPRKRIDVLLRVVSVLRADVPTVRLVKTGGPFTRSHRALIDELGLQPAITVLPFVDKATLGALYRRAAVVLLPSEREGFGLPVVEAMACGTPVIASDIPALREVGGDAATYCRVGDVQHWTETVLDFLQQQRDKRERWVGRRNACIQQASKFTWKEHAAKMVEIYQQALNS